MAADGAGKAGKADEEGFFEDWPKWSKPVFALCAMILLGGLWIGIPLLSALKVIELNFQSEGQVDYQPMMAVLIAMTTATITGVFVFMTFRIDRGTRLKAERVAKDRIKKVVDEELARFAKTSDGRLNNFRKTSDAELVGFGRTARGKFAEFKRDSDDKLGEFDGASKKRLVAFDAASERKLGEFDENAKSKLVEFEEKLDESTKPEVVQQAIHQRIPEDALRALVESVLLANANGQIVMEYARERAAAMDAKAVEVLLGLLRETIEDVAPQAEQEPEEDRGGPWTRARAATAGWWHRRR